MTKPGWFARGALVGALALMVPQVALAKPKLAALAQSRIDAAAKVYAAVEAQWRAGRGTVDAVGMWSVRWVLAARDQPHTRKTLAVALDAHLVRMQALQTEATRQVGAGLAGATDSAIAAYYVAEAELWAARGE